MKRALISVIVLLLLASGCKFLQKKAQEEEEEESLVGKSVTITLTTGDELQGMVVMEEDECLIVKGESGTGKIPRQLIQHVEVIEKEDLPRPPMSGRLLTKPRQINYVAREGQSVFHKPECRFAREIPTYRKLTFETREEAIQRGLKPCGSCNP